jgi:hypothetical protein
MQPEEKPFKKYLPVIITAGVMIVLAAGLVFGTWYLMDQRAKKTATENNAKTETLNKQIEVLQKQYETQTAKLAGDAKSAAANAANANSVLASQVKYTDTEQVIVATIGKFNNPNYIPSVRIVKIEGNWAAASPVPLTYNQDTGYAVPGMGGVTYLWNKKDGKWAYVGAMNETGWDAVVKAQFAQIPKTVIPDSQR